MLFHDESTFRSGEQLSSRWFKKGSEPFISKGKGRSWMVSDFLVAHPSSAFFSLNEEEWSEAIKKYPSLTHDNLIHYETRTCTGGIIPGQEGYFDNNYILSQFERLFQMLEFKQAYNYPVKHRIEIVVDNARTHTSQVCSLNEFRLN